MITKFSPTTAKKYKSWSAQILSLPIFVAAGFGGLGRHWTITNTQGQPYNVLGGLILKRDESFVEVNLVLGPLMLAFCYLKLTKQLK